MWKAGPGAHWGTMWPAPWNTGRQDSNDERSGQRGTKSNHAGIYLDCHKSDVSKLLVETGDLLIMNPYLVLCGHLRRRLYVSSGKKKKTLRPIKTLLPSGPDLPQTTGLPGSCTPCRCLHCRRALWGAERAASDTRSSLMDTGWCTALQHPHCRHEQRQRTMADTFLSFTQTRAVFKYCVDRHPRWYTDLHSSSPEDKP